MRTAPGPVLPRQLHVFVRDWLSSNNILLKSRDGHVLIDSGYVRHAPLTLALLASPKGLGDAPLTKLVNTHCHSDHMGGNAAIKARYGCPIVARSEGAKDPARDERHCCSAIRRQRFSVDKIIKPGETHILGDLEWRARCAGHDTARLRALQPRAPGSSSPATRWGTVYGLVCRPRPTPLPFRLHAALEMLAGLDIRTVIRDTATIHRRRRARTRSPTHRSVRKLTVCGAHTRSRPFAASRALKAADAPRRLPAYVTASTFIASSTPASSVFHRELANLLVGELERAGGTRREDGWLVPA
jgi:hypothetical protein